MKSKLKKNEHRILLSVIVSVIVFANGCSSRPDLRPYIDKAATPSGVGSMITPVFEEINLVSLLDPDYQGVDMIDDAAAKKKYMDGTPTGEEIDIAFNAFMLYDETKWVQRRNAIQEHIIAASEQRCNYFKNYMKTSRSFANFGLGSLATLTGTLGAIFTGAGTSQSLSGAAAILSGVRAEFNQELFANLAANVIATGIDLRRREMYEQIALHGQSKPYEVYTVEAAVKDAIAYHGKCNVMTGIEVAGDTVKKMEDPGFDTANRVLIKLNMTNKLLAGGDLSTEEQIKLYRRTTDLLQAGTPLKEEKEIPIPNLPIDRMQSALSAVQEKTELLQNKIGDLGKDKNIKEDKCDALKIELDEATNHIEKQINSCRKKATIVSENYAIALIKYRSEKLKNTDSKEVMKAESKEKIMRKEAELVLVKIEELEKEFIRFLTEVDNVVSSIKKEDEEDLNEKNLNEVQALLNKTIEIKTECSE